MINAVTGRDQYLYDSLIKELEKAEEIKIIVSFLRESGAQLLAESLKKAALKNLAEIKILTSRYLNITEPSAIYLLKDKLGDLADIRFFADQEMEDQAISFHPKAYFFKHKKEQIIFIGSSNISYSALHGGIEWNYRLEKERDQEAFKEFKEDFNDLYQNYSVEITDQLLKSYAAEWIKPSISREIDKSSYLEREKEYDEQKNKEQQEANKPKPRGAQIEALYELKL